jgi:2-phospho-L-lactate guanylyltransferase
VAGIAVVSADPEVRALAGAWAATWIEDSPEAGLNQALIRGRRHALRAGARRVLVLPADLPRLTPQPVAALLAMADSPPSAVIAPDRHGSGTNALLLAPPGLIEYTFGPLSFMRHLEMAEAAGARTRICRSPAFALDLDLPEDLVLLSEPGPSPDLRA